MNKFFQWVKEHVVPFIRFPDRENGVPMKGPKGPDDRESKDKLKDLANKAEVGIKVNWKF